MPRQPFRTMTRSSLLTRRSALGFCACMILASFPACSQQSGGTTEQGRVTASGPVGLFFMTRYWSFTRTLEKAAWYFTPDGHVYQNLKSGLTSADLAAHKGPKGTFKFSGTQLEITWSDGKTSKSNIERDKGSDGFMWDMGIFNPAPPLSDPKLVVGTYEGGESLSHGGNAVATSNTFEFRADGTYTRSGVASVKGTTSQSVVSAGSQGTSTGTWKAEAYSLTLTGSDGTVTRRIAFPYFEDDKSALPARLYFGGLLLKRQ